MILSLTKKDPSLNTSAMSKPGSKKKAPRRRKINKVRPLVSELSEEGRIAHYNAVLIENLDSKFKLVIEHVEGMRETFGRDIDQLKQQVSGLDCKVNNLEYTVISLKQSVDKGFAENEAWHREALQFFKRIDSKLDNHEERITHLEGDVVLLRNTQ